MTTKWKIIVGFVVMIILIGVIAAIGYFGLSTATQGLGDYRRVAGVNVRMSDILANQYAAASAFRLFRIEANPKLMEEARGAIKNNEVLIRESRERASRKETLAALDAVEKMAVQQQDLLSLVEKDLLDLLNQFLKGAQPAARNLGDALIAMNDATAAAGNISGGHATAQAFNALAYFRSALTRFAYRPTQADGDRAMEMMANLTKSMQELSKFLHTDAERAAFAQFQKGHDEMAKALDAMRAYAIELDKQNTALMKLNAEARAAVQEANSGANDLMNEVGPRTVAANETAQATMLTISFGGLLVGALLAVFIIFGLVRALRNMSAFADAIAEGDFSAQVHSREKGEIGHMLQALHKIPQVLEELITELKGDVDKILIGDYKVRVHAASFPGSYETLAASVNNVCDAYTRVLDLMPLAIFSATRDKKILYSNALAQKVLGGEKIGNACGDCFKTSKCNTAECFATKAMAAKAPVSGEVDIHPAPGVDLELAVTAVPMADHTGSIEGFMEICTDITEAKKQQRMIRSVTEQAASISNRVAAASEELSAQVEQVSRGAEMQRDRVESTASAMTEMNSTVLEVARSAGEASEQSEQTRTKAHDGEALVGKVVQSINMVHKVAGTLQTNMQELGAQAESIGGVMNVISDIADQTNLLALNAAIEAARAGDAGRGFAVVADEVRKLAEKTMSATHEVGSNISAIQNSARTNLNEVTEAGKAIAEATDLANTSGQALEEIVSLASANSAVVASIATAAEQQSATSEEISHAIEEINKIVGETTDGMVQSSAAVQELSRMAQELNAVMGELQK